MKKRISSGEKMVRATKPWSPPVTPGQREKLEKRLVELQEMESLENLLRSTGISKTSLALELGVSREALIGAMNRGLSTDYRLRIEQALARRAQLLVDFQFESRKLKRVK